MLLDQSPFGVLRIRETADKPACLLNKNLSIEEVKQK